MAHDRLVRIHCPTPRIFGDPEPPEDTSKDFCAACGRRLHITLRIPPPMDPKTGRPFEPPESAVRAAREYRRRQAEARAAAEHHA